MAFGYVSNLLKLRVMNMQNLRCFDICKLFNHVHSSSEVELINVIFLLTMQLQIILPPLLCFQTLRLPRVVFVACQKWKVLTESYNFGTIILPIGATQHAVMSKLK